MSNGHVIDDFVLWCDESFLQLNISKMKDVSVDCRSHVLTHEVTIFQRSDCKTHNIRKTQILKGNSCPSTDHWE